MTFNKYPSVKFRGNGNCLEGWRSIYTELSLKIQTAHAHHVVIECYHGVYIQDILNFIADYFPEAQTILSSNAYRSEDEIIKLTYPNITDDRVFGFMTSLELRDLFDPQKIQEIHKADEKNQQLIFIVGIGASLIEADPDLVIYADMARWELQMRMRRKEVANIGLSNQQNAFELQYKRGYFLDWRLCDKVKKNLIPKADFVLDTNDRKNPKLLTGSTFMQALKQTVQQPFSLMPFFDPGPWGGQWMKEKFQLDPAAPNYAWCFNCVPEENSLLIDFDGVKFETPAINMVLFEPVELLGKKVQNIFGDEFPIRFDFLDTVQGGNLSLQVHPLTNYIKEKFGMSYTQDESYYILDAEPDATVYLGLVDNVDKTAMLEDLKSAQKDPTRPFNADQYAKKWPAKKHDHFLIPAGTVHCSGSGCMVLEISATPYIFTFKLWDWGRLGMDGKPRPIYIEHGSNVIQWDRQVEWTRSNLINQFNTIEQNEDFIHEHTGLHDLEFIETRRFTQSGKVSHRSNDSVNVLMIVEGEQAIVESPDGLFNPFIVNYAEAFVIPAGIKSYDIRPYGASAGKSIMVIKAFVRV
jgi:mannose-6-phosphate isomerase class I